MNLVFEQGGLAGQVFPLERSMICIGRTGDNDLTLPEHGVSRRHASIRRVSQGWLLTDLGSTNGTYVEGRRIGEAHLLQPGERVAIGSSVFLVQQATEEPAPPGAGRQGGTARLSPVVMAVGAICLVLLLIGLVLLLVTVLQPEEAAPVPTHQPQMEGLFTALPVPTQMQDMMTSIVPMFSTVLPGFPVGSTATPEPGSSIPGTEILGRQADATPSAPHPAPPALSGSREVGP
ncbi:FHA domain-containing protein [Chloroflexota bacterium]